MARRGAVALGALCIVLGALLANPTFGSTSAAAERSVSVAVADDGAAYLGAGVSAETITSNGTAVLTLTNRLGADASLDVDSTSAVVSDADGDLDGSDLAVSAPESIPAGGSADVVVACADGAPSGADGTVEIEFQTTAVADGVSVDFARTATNDVAC